MEAGRERWVPEGTVRIPLLGEVAAGRPLEMYAVQDELDVPDALWNGRRVFALRVRGQSMVEAGIHDGDYLIVEPREQVDDGRTVVVELDGSVTVKKIYRGRNGQIRLQPANSEMLPLVVHGEHVRVLGVVVGVLRKYGFPEARRTSGASRGKLPAPSGRNTRSADRAVAKAEDCRTLDLALNAIDSQLERWRAVAERVRRTDAGQALRMDEMGRDLQALREWSGRTSRPGLRRAMIAEANRIMQRMERFLAAHSLELPDCTVH